MKRISYIDIAKGIMILLVIWHHIYNIYDSLFGERFAFEKIESFDYFYVPFFMQAFFFLNGMTSNFNRTIKDQIINDTKKLLLPLLTFGLISYFVSSVVFNSSSIWTFVGGERYLYIFECYWFFPALCLSRCIESGLIHAFKKPLIRLSIWLILMLLGFGISYYCYGDKEIPSHYMNFLHYRNALCMGIFIEIGYFFKDKINKKYLFVFGLCYSLAIVFTFYFNIIIAPYYTHCFYSNFSALSIPYFLFFACTGTSLVLYISQRIKKNGFLEYCGRNSLIIYGIHFVILKIITKTLNHFINVYNLGAINWYLLVFSTCIFGCVIIIEIFNRTKLKYLIGKF